MMTQVTLIQPGGKAYGRTSVPLDVLVLTWGGSVFFRTSRDIFCAVESFNVSGKLDAVPVDRES